MKSKDVKWVKVQSGTYQASGTSVQVIRRDDTAELWDVTYLLDGKRLHAWPSPTMREARACAFGYIRAELSN